MGNCDVQSYVIVGSVEFTEPKTYEKPFWNLLEWCWEFLAASCHGYHTAQNACWRETKTFWGI